jgi:peptide/nickel transport system substrate-binding protein
MAHQYGRKHEQTLLENRFSGPLGRRSFLQFAGIALTAWLTGCQTTPGSLMPDQSSATDEPHAGSRSGGTLSVGMAASSIVTLDPAAYSDRATETVLRNIFDGLVTRTTDNQVVPELAERIEWPDERTVQFTLKRNVKFHNGAPLTADDVVFTFERLLTQPVGVPRRSFLQKVARVEAVDEQTVRFVLESPWPILMQMLVHNQIVPKGYLLEVGDEGFAQAPVGCGPFKVAEATLNRRVVLERFDDYYGGASLLPPAGPPYLERAIFTMIPDAVERASALLAGDVQIIQSVPFHLVSELTSDPTICVKSTVGTRPKMVDLNVTAPPFDDVRVRQALNYAVNAEEILKQVEGGYGMVLAGPLSPANLYVDPGLAPYGYDPGKALSLLASAGYWPGDITLTLDAYGPYLETADAVVKQLQSFGIRAAVAEGDYDALKPQLLNCERQAFLRDWGDSAFDPVGYVEAKWQTRTEGTAAGRANYSCYSNPLVDQLIEAGAAEPVEEKRRETYRELQRVIRAEAPAIFLYVPQEIEAASIRVRNWQPSPDSRINLHDVWLRDRLPVE